MQFGFDRKAFPLAAWVNGNDHGLHLCIRRLLVEANAEHTLLEERCGFA
jgi:hypothetical protein